MRRKPLIAAAILFLSFLAARYLLPAAALPRLAYAEGHLAVAVGKHLRWIGPEGKMIGTLDLPEASDRLLSFDGALGIVSRDTERFWLHRPDGTWEHFDLPKGVSGGGAWAAGSGRLYFLQLRPAEIWVRDVSGDSWRDFLAEGEELENPVDLAVQGTGLAVLNRDPAEAVVFDASGRSLRRFDLSRSKLWPLQRLVFESPMDYLRPRHCDVPRRLWAREDGRLAVLFTTEDGSAPRLVALDPGTGGSLSLLEVLLALRTEGQRRKARLQDFAFLPDGTAVVTSNQGGLWLHDQNLKIRKEWEVLPPPQGRARTVGAAAGPWLILAASLFSLLWAAWPRSDAEGAGTPPPRRAWTRALASLLLPGLGQAFQRRWGWSAFWFLWTAAWAGTEFFLTLRLKGGGFVSPATYIEGIFALAASWLGGAFQAFWFEWNRPQA